MRPWAHKSMGPCAHSPIGPWAHGPIGRWAHANCPWVPENSILETFLENGIRKQTTPRTLIFGSASKSRAHSWRRYLYWSREGPNQAIFENPYLVSMWPGRPGHPSTGATCQPGHSSISSKWRICRTVTPWVPSPGWLRRKIFPKLATPTVWTCCPGQIR